MTDFVLKEYTQEEYEADMRKELAQTSLYNCVKLRCDLINDECVNQQMGYIPHRTIQELMCEILNLIELNKSIYEQGRADAIEEFKEKCKDKRYKPSKFTSINVVDYADIDEIAEQLKEQK